MDKKKINIDNINIESLIFEKCDKVKDFSNFISFLCPYHTENNPSCFYIKSKNIFKCFGCLKYGTKYDLYCKLNNVLSNVFLYHNNNNNNLNIISKEQKYFELIYLFYNQSNIELNKNRIIIDKFLKFRNLCDYKEKILLKLGFVNYKLLNFFNSLIFKKQYFIKDLIDSKIFYLDVSNKLKLSFKNYIIFPLYNKRGLIFGIGGQNILTKQYKNLGNNKYFSKKYSILTLKSFFNCNLDCIIICEGYFDMLSLHLNNFTNTIALSGVFMSEFLVNFLIYKNKTIILCLDNDEVGFRSILTIVKQFFKKNFYKIVIINYDILINNNCKDVDELLQKKQKIKEIFKKTNLLNIAQFLYKFFYIYHNKNLILYKKQKILNFFFSILVLIKNPIILEDFFIFLNIKLKIKIIRIKKNFYFFKKKFFNRMNIKLISNNIQKYSNISIYIYETLSFLEQNKHFYIFFYFIILLGEFNDNKFNYFKNHIRKNVSIKISTFDNYFDIICKQKILLSKKYNLKLLLFFWLYEIKKYLIFNKKNNNFIKSIRFLYKLSNFLNNF